MHDEDIRREGSGVPAPPINRLQLSNRFHSARCWPLTLNIVGDGLLPVSRVAARTCTFIHSFHSETSSFMFKQHKEMSEVWKYFERFDDKENKHVQCMLCKSKLKFTSSTSVMWNHLKCKHATCVALNKIGNKRSLDTSTDSSQNIQIKPNENLSESVVQEYQFFQLGQAPKILDEPFKKKFAYHTETFSHHHEDTQGTSEDTQTSSIAKMLIEDLLPVSMIEGIGFKSLILSLNPRYNLPTKNEIKTQIQYLYEVEKLRIENVVSKTQHVTLTTNCWKDSEGDNYVTVGLHAVTKDWIRMEYTLHSQFLGRSIGDNIKTVVDSVTDAWDLQYKVLAVVHDNPNGIVKSYKSSREIEKNISCFGYLLNKSLNAGFSMAAENLISASIAIIDRILYVEKANTGFVEEQHLRSEELFRSDGKSWISVYKMFESMIEQRRAISSVLLNKNIFMKSEEYAYELSEYDWALMENLKNTICPFALSTDFLKSDKIPTLSTVNPLISTLIDNFLQIQIGDCDVIRNFKTTVTRELRANFNLDSDVASVLDLCTFFDPRYKKYQRAEGLSSKVVNLVECLISVVIPDSDVKKTETLVDFLFPREVASNQESEIDMYVNEVEINKNMCPLQWWKYNEHRFPFVAKLASKYLSIPATSVLPSRVFGARGDGVCARRAGLEKGFANMMIFLHDNVKK